MNAYFYSKAHYGPHTLGLLELKLNYSCRVRFKAEICPLWLNRIRQPGGRPVEVKGQNGLFRSRLLFDDLLPAFLIVAPETSRALFAFLQGCYP